VPAGRRKSFTTKKQDNKKKKKKKKKKKQKKKNEKKKKKKKQITKQKEKQNKQKTTNKPPALRQNQRDSCQESGGCRQSSAKSAVSWKKSLQINGGRLPAKSRSGRTLPAYPGENKKVAPTPRICNIRRLLLDIQGPLLHVRRRPGRKIGLQEFLRKKSSGLKRKKEKKIHSHMKKKRIYEKKKKRQRQGRTVRQPNLYRENSIEGGLVAGLKITYASTVAKKDSRSRKEALQTAERTSKEIARLIEQEKTYREKTIPIRNQKPAAL